MFNLNIAPPAVSSGSHLALTEDLGTRESFMDQLCGGIWTTSGFSTKKQMDYYQDILSFSQ